MMAEVRETEVTREGNVVDRNTVIERPIKKKGGFGWGMMLGVLIVAGAIVAFAYNQGSFQTAGRQADRATETAQVQANQTADNARAAVHDATGSDNAAPAQSN
jgi:hypothetical protein